MTTKIDILPFVANMICALYDGDLRRVQDACKGLDIVIQGHFGTNETAIELPSSEDIDEMLIANGEGL